MTAARSSTAGAAGPAGMTDRTVKELSDIAQLAVELARRAGADDAEALVRDDSDQKKRNNKQNFNRLINFRNYIEI
jgi:hypothetical protein